MKKSIQFKVEFPVYVRLDGEELADFRILNARLQREYLLNMADKSMECDTIAPVITDAPDEFVSLIE